MYPSFARVLTNNVIANNVAGWDGGGLSLLDALAVNLVNNSVISNNSTASSGVLFQTLFAPVASTQGSNCTTKDKSQSCPQPAGLVSVDNSAVLTANMAQIPGGVGSITCPANHGTVGGASDCTKFSIPEMYNDLFWQNRSLIINVGALGGGLTNQQNMVQVYDPVFGGTPAPAAGQGHTGACDDPNAATSYWDLGARGDTGPSSHSPGGTLSPFYSGLTNTTQTGAGTNNNLILAGNSTLTAAYCNGARTPVASGGSGWDVPPGTNESNALPAPPFTLLAGAVVDEGNNWINLKWGPLSLDPTFVSFDASLVPGAPAIDYVPKGTAEYAAAPSTDFFGNPRPDGNKNSNIDIGAIEFQGLKAPTLISITPNSGVAGTTVNVTLSGTNLTGTTSINVSGTGVAVSNLTMVNSTTVTATFTLATTATLGAHTVSVTTPGGTSNTVTFTVTAAPAPTLTSISPNTGLRGASVNVTLTGTNLIGTSAINVSGNGITVTSLNVVSATTVTATFVIASNGNSVLGAHDVTVTTPGGSSNAVTFTVVVPPALSSISPTAGNQGATVNVTLTGSGLTGATAINISPADIAVSNLVVVSDTSITATFTIGSTASLSGHTVNVTTPVGTSTSVTFTVRPPAPTLASISPTAGNQGTTALAVAFTGTNFTGATAITVGNGVTVTSFTVASSTSITATFNLSNATQGTPNVTVTTPSGSSNAVTFTVRPPAPTLTTISPNTGNQGTTALAVTLTGTNFTGATAITVGNGVTVTSFTVASSTSITATFNLSNATPGTSNATVSTASGTTTNAVTFTVIPPAPTLTSINPTSGNRGTTGLAVTLTGNNLTGATAVSLGGAGVTCAGITVNPAGTSLTTTCTITSTATLSTRSVTVTTPGGTSSTTSAPTFTVNGPTLISITPASGNHNTTVAVTLNGTDLTGATAVTMSITSGGGNNGVSCTVTGTTATSISASCTISNNARLTTRDVTATTPNGTTNTLLAAFTVN